MSYQFYNILHFVGLSLTLIALGGASFATYIEGKKPISLKKKLGILHGIGILIMLVAGFGMLARLGILSNLPTWIYLKISLWLFLGAWIAVVYKLAIKHPVISALIPVVVVILAGWAAHFKPL